MGIWVLTLVWAMGALAWTTLCAAFLGKTGRGWLYWLLLTPWLLWTMGASIWLAVMSYSLFERGIRPSYMPHAVTFAFLVIVGSLVVVIAGNLRRDGRLAAGSWPVLRLFLIWIGVSAAQLAVLWYLDAGVRREMDQVREQINRQYAALLRPVQSPESNAADSYAEAFSAIKAELDAADAAEEQRSYAELAKRNEAAANAVDAGKEIDYQFGPAIKKPSELIAEGDINDPPVFSLIKSLEPAIHQLRVASLRPMCRSDRNQEPPDINRALPSLQNYRTAAQLLRCHALVETEAHQFPSAIEDVETMHRMARHVQQTAVGLVPFLVAVGTDALADQALAEILPYANTTVSLPAAATVSDEMLDAELRAALVGEYAFEVRAVLDFCDGLVTSSAGVPIPRRAAMGYGILYLHADLTAFRQMHEATVARLDRAPVPQQVNWALHGGPPTGGPLSQILTTSLGRLLDKPYPNKQAHTRAATVAVAATNYRIDTGHYPSSLEELVPKYLPAIPADPFDGKPMRYLLKDGQVTIYSVGDDRVDDGGQLEHKEDEPRSKTLDVGLELKAPASSAPPAAENLP